jgi:hypothetical protein
LTRDFPIATNENYFRANAACFSPRARNISATRALINAYTESNASRNNLWRHEPKAGWQVNPEQQGFFMTVTLLKLGLNYF